MRLIITLISVFVIGMSSFSANGQVQWMANANFHNAAYASLYNMVADGNPVIIAVGDLHAQASERLLASGVMQDLTSQHDAGELGDRFSTKDLRVAFVNVQVMASEAAQTLPKGLQVIPMKESDEALNAAGWDALYSINSTDLFLVTPDHLVRQLKGKTAEEIYAEARMYNTKIRPQATPDIRLLDAAASNTGKTVQVRVQNFSTVPVKHVEISVLKNGQQIAQASYETSIASLEDAVIPVSLPAVADASLTIIAKVDGDTNQLNNRWTGALSGAADASMIAGTFGN